MWTNTVANTDTNTFTNTDTNTVTYTDTDTVTNTYTNTVTNTETKTVTNTDTNTVTNTVTNTDANKDEDGGDLLVTVTCGTLLSKKSWGWQASSAFGDIRPIFSCEIDL